MLVSSNTTSKAGFNPLFEILLETMKRKQGTFLASFLFSKSLIEAR